MKRIKNLFIIATIFVLSLVVNVNADTCNTYAYFKNEGDNVLNPGDELEIEAGYCFGEQGKETHFDLEFDRDVFTLLTDNPFVDPGCEITDFKYVASGEVLSTTFKQDDSCGLIKLNYKFKVNDVASKSTKIQATNGSIKFDIVNPNNNNGFKSGLYYLKNLTIEGIPEDNNIEFDKYHNSYYITAPYSSQKINIIATPGSNKTKVYGAGEIELIVGRNNVFIVVASEDGDFNQYQLFIDRVNENGAVPVDTVKEFSPKVPGYNEDIVEEQDNNLEIDNPFNMYLFYGEGCPHCADLEKFLDSIDDEYGKYFNLVKYEVWYSKSNNRLFEKVVDRMHTDSEKIGVPYLVIGDDYIMGYGNTEEENKQIINNIMRVYNSSTRYDVIKDETINTEDEKNEIVEESKDDTVKELKKLKTYLEIVSGCCILVIALFVGFIIVNNRKKTTEEKSE